jgi:hypothetical protein
MNHFAKRYQIKHINSKNKFSHIYTEPWGVPEITTKLAVYTFSTFFQSRRVES